MGRLIQHRTVDEAALTRWTAPRDNGLYTENAVAGGRFEAATGPFDAYERRIDVDDRGDGTYGLTETIEYRIAAPFWKLVVSWPLRRALRKGPDLTDTPWWAPPDHFDARTANTVSLLCIAAIVTGYLGAVIGQTATFATDEFGSSDREQGLLLAGVRVGTIVTVAITALADRRGRKRLLILSMVAGCLLTVLGAASTGLVTLGISQAGARGFATAISILIGIMAAEVSPRGSRAYIASVLTLTAGLGAGIPVWFLFLADLSERGWRLLFLIAVPMLPVVAWIGRNLRESDRFERHAERRVLPAELAGGHHRGAEAGEGMRWDRLVVVAAVAFVALMFAAPASQFRNEFLRDERGFSAAQVTLFVLAANTPQGLGVAIAGKMADRRGRKPVAAFTVGVGAAFTVLTYVFSGVAMWVAAVLAGIIAAGAAPALGVYGAEMFGTARRGRANGIVSLVAVAGSATGLVLVGELSDRFDDFGKAFAYMAICPLLVVVLVLVFYPESARRELEDLNPGDRQT